LGNDDDDKGKHGNEGNDSKEGHEDDEDDKNGDGCNDATDDVIFDCAAGTQSKAPSGANLADSPLSCWGCNKKLHSSVLCGDSILNLLSNNPSFIGMSLNNGRIIELDDNNETRTLCCICIAPLSAGLMKSSIDNRAATMLLPIETRKAAMLVIHPPWVIGNEGNDSEDGHEDDEDNKNGDGCDDATNNVILDCAAGTQCKAPSGANLTDSPHLCWGCNKRNNKSRQIDYWFFRGVGVNGVWPSLYDVVVPWLRLPIPINSIPHPYWMYTKCFSTLRCCGWAYECILML
jgi:hypothetical protein